MWWSDVIPETPPCQIETRVGPGCRFGREKNLPGGNSKDPCKPDHTRWAMVAH